MREPSTPPSPRYLLAVLATAAAVALRWFLNPILHENLPFVTLFGAVAVAVGFGGYRPAILATILGYVAVAFLFIHPRGTLGFTEIQNIVGLIAYIVSCAIIIGFGEAMRVARRRFEDLASRHEQISRAMSARIEEARRKHNLRNVTIIGFGLTLVILIAGGVVGTVNARRLATSEKWVAHTHQVIANLESLLSTIKDAETGQRGYLLTEDEQYLKPYYDALERVESQLASLKQLTADNPSQQARLPALQAKISARLDVLHQSVTALKAGDRPAAVDVVRSGIGKMLMDDLRRNVSDAQQLEEELLRKRVIESEARAHTTGLSILLTTLTGVVLVGIVFYLSQRNAVQRQRAADLAAEQRERLRTTLASIGDAVISTDADGVITYQNAVAESLTGWKLDDAVGQPLDSVFRIINEETRQPVTNPARRALTEGIIVGLANHTVLIAKDGAERPIDDSAAPIRCEGGEIVGCVLVFRDVTDRRRAEDAVRKNEQRLRFVMDSMPQKIFTARPNGAVDYFNPFWTEFTGLPFEQIRDWGWTQFVHPDDVAENVRIWRKSVETGEPFTFEQRFLRADGAYRWHLSRAKALKDADGKVLMWVGSNTEIHEQLQAANDLRELAARLSEADHRKNEFLAMLAHELRNPLAPIRNALQIVQLSGGNGDAVKSASQMMERQIGQLVRLVDDLLDISRISRGTIDLRRERVDLASIINQAIETCRPSIDAARHQLTLSLPAEPIYLYADPVRLAQSFSNLMNNACKYSDPGGRIELAAERQGNDVVVSVKDNGVGIPPDMLPRIFDMFTQVDRSLERSQGGLGIGLTLVQRMVEMHGGSVRAFSDGPGRGSEFVVRLPIFSDNLLPPVARIVGEPTPAVSRRILVVDDNRDSATSLAMVLKLTGNETRTAHDGLEALEAAADFRPDVVLLDIGLPQLNGYEAAQKIRQQSWGKSILLIALTGYGQDEDRQASKSAGFDGHLVKPVDHEELMSMIAGLHPVPATASSTQTAPPPSDV